MDIFKAKAIVTIFGNPVELILLLLAAIGLGFAIAWTYRKTHRGFSYSQSFSTAIVLVTVITAFIVALIQNNIAAAIGIFGAFSIIRFRTAVKDVRDVAFIFFALSAGLAMGLGSVLPGILGVGVICALVFILHKSNFGGLRRLEYVLNFKMNAKDHSNDVFKEIMVEYLKKQTLLNVDAKERGTVLVFTFNVSLKDGDQLSEFINKMSDLEGVSDVSVVSSKNDLEF
ncbi:DUF4956 domain-containing protein [Candidatus Peregrinibacteria bacterium]|jgi:uncharacterized membrane protein YhiD involved in acid resistance|nr:DUF4956 domain-containing protein [Candidatus Peregrinibacteria bacterium]MBT4056153.1 DUF4956 domain-containing protein [Candidatus Peregrinibacteria bacterium]